MWAYITGILAAIAIYVAIINTYIISPFSLPWQRLFGHYHSPEGYQVRGIDISHHQGNISWEQLKQANVDSQPLSFIIIKATEGTDLTDQQYTHNHAQAHAANIICGAYHFFNPDTDPRRQAHHYLRQANLQPGDLPPILDVETRGHLNPGQLQAAVLTWLRIAEEYYGTPPILYTSASFKRKYLNDPRFDPYPYWIAHYYVDQPNHKGTWAFWQYTDIGHIAGIKGNVDLDIYNGTLQQLRQLTLTDE